MFGFVKVIPEPVVVPNKLSDAIMEGDLKYKQAHGQFRNGEKLCALMVAYTVTWGCPAWMGNDDGSPSPNIWKGRPMWEKLFAIVAIPPLLVAFGLMLGAFLTRLRVRYNVPYIVLWKVIEQNDSGKNFRQIAYNLRSRGY